MDKDFITERSHGQLILILMIAAYFLLMFGNGAISLTHPDEVFYVQTAKEMIQHKSWLTPMIFDKPQFEKPIFCYWLLISALKWGGATPFAARFWPALFGILGVAVTYWIAWMLFGSKRTAFLSGLVLSSSLIYLALSRAVLTDMIFSILVVITIGFFYLAHKYPRFRGPGIVLHCFFMALAVLAKGVLGLTFPLGTALVYLIYKKDLAFLKNKAFISGALVFSVVALPWHMLMYQQYGQTFISEYWYNDHVRRIIDAEHQKSNTWYFYLITMMGGVMPWTLFLFPALAGINQKLKERSSSTDALLFLLVWIAVVFIIVQSAASKLASYIFPVFPAIAILLGFYLDDLISKGGKASEKPLAKCLYFSIGLAVLMPLGAVVASRVYHEYVANSFGLYLFAALSLVWVMAVLMFFRRKNHLAVILAQAFMTVNLLVVVAFSLPSIEPWVSCKEICDKFQGIDQSKSPILTSKFYARGVRFYTDRNIAVMDINGEGFFSPHPIPFLNSDDKVRNFLFERPLTYAIVKKNDLKDLQRIVDGHALKLTELNHIGGKFIVKIENRR